MASQTIAAAGNTEVPAYLTLIKLGYAVDCVDQSGEELWSAKKGTLQLLANGPLELLGLSLLSSERDPNWQASDGEIGEFLKRFPPIRLTGNSVERDVLVISTETLLPADGMSATAFHSSRA